MVEDRTSGHAVFELKYRVAWITQYRRKILRGRVAERGRDPIRQSCEALDVTIVRGAISPDHVRMLMSAPAQLAPAKLVQYIKGRSSRRLQDEFAELRKRYWGQHLWARWLRRRSANTPSRSSGMRKIRASKSARPPSLEPALSRAAFRRLQPRADFQSEPNPPPLGGGCLDQRYPRSGRFDELLSVPTMSRQAFLCRSHDTIRVSGRRLRSAIVSRPCIRAGRKRIDA